MKSNNTKGNPWHDEEGKFTSGDNIGKQTEEEKTISSEGIKLKPNIDFASILGAQKKEEIKQPQIDYSNKIIANNLKVNAKDFAKFSKGIKLSLSAGTPEAQKIISNLFAETGVPIEKDDAAYCVYVDRFTRRFTKTAINFYSADLLSNGKFSGHRSIGESFFHESFHALDSEYYFKDRFHKSISCNFVLSNGKTLKQIYSEEVADNKYSHNMDLFNDIKKQFEQAVIDENNKKYSPEGVQKINENILNLNIELKNINKRHSNGEFKNYDEYKKEFLETRKMLVEEIRKKEYGKDFATRKFNVMSDFCSFIYRTGIEGSICGGHGKKYWNDGENPIKEMFAEMGSMWSRNDTEQISLIQKYFPNTYNGFLEIINNLEEIKEKIKNGNG